ncbi:MAG: hypothetical protein ACOWWH_08570 [Eubacteriaceae bacterium]
MSIITKKELPDQLWLNGNIHMPICLINSYELLLKRYDVMEKALDQNNTGNIIGGITFEDTIEHFARRYGVSSCRIEGLLIDPDNGFLSLSEDLIKILSEGKIFLLDIACGTGSVGASLLSTLYILRKERIMPCLPLSIQIVGGDCSQPALKIYEQMMEELVNILKETGIETSLKTVEWHAEDSYKTSELFDFIFDKYKDLDEYIIFVANFSGSMDNHFDEYKDSFQHLFDRLHNKSCTILWVEPGDSSSGKSLFSKLSKRINTKAWGNSNQVGPINYEYKWFHPFQKRQLPCRILLKTYDNNRSKK